MCAYMWQSTPPAISNWFSKCVCLCVCYWGILSIKHQINVSEGHLEETLWTSPSGLKTQKLSQLLRQERWKTRQHEVNQRYEQSKTTVTHHGDVQPSKQSCCWLMFPHGHKNNRAIKARSARLNSRLHDLSAWNVFAKQLETTLAGRMWCLSNKTPANVNISISFCSFFVIIGGIDAP